MNENVQFLFPLSLFVLFSILFIQIAIKINHFCVFPSSGFLMNLIILSRKRFSRVPFHSYALRLWESFTFNVYFCWKKAKKEERKIYFLLLIYVLLKGMILFSSSLWGEREEKMAFRILNPSVGTEVQIIRYRGYEKWGNFSRNF